MSVRMSKATWELKVAVHRVGYGIPFSKSRRL